MDNIQNRYFNNYLSLIRSFPMLHATEEMELVMKVKNTNCILSIEKLVKSHLRLVVKIAMEFKSYGMSMIDLISEGTIGLIYSVKKFMPEKGVRFATYAMWWIKAYIKDYIIKTWSMIKIGTHTSHKKIFFNLNKIKKISNQIEQTINTDTYPQSSTMREVAKEINVSYNNLVETKNRINNPGKFLNETLDNDNCLIEKSSMREEGIMSNEDTYIAQADCHKKRNIMKAALATLSERERYIIYARKISEPALKLRELASDLKISCERIRQVELSAMNKLKNFAKHSNKIADTSRGKSSLLIT